ncbi:hypothetical protein NC651_022831 [Populus alba x Populus x berolinensis]|nr:hypothetical protein NC651_022831 [Populus alba x Populus x berolinensis]
MKIKSITPLHRRGLSVRNGDGDAVVRRSSEEGDGGSEISGIFNIISIKWCRDGANPLWKRGQENKEREKDLKELMETRGQRRRRRLKELKIKLRKKESAVDLSRSAALMIFSRFRDEVLSSIGRSCGALSILEKLASSHPRDVADAGFDFWSSHRSPQSAQRCKILQELNAPKYQFGNKKEEVTAIPDSFHYHQTRLGSGRWEWVSRDTI